jgi:hypothetical protein
VIGADGMGISARLYPDIVRDTLTVLTRGIAGERCDVAIDTSTPRPIASAQLRRPAKRVSSVSGLLSAPDGSLTPHTFGLDEYELLGEPGDPESLRVVRIRPHGANQPAAGTQLTVNYYPRSAEPSPITDVTVGGVARTLIEAISHELAVVSAQVEHAYDAAFVDTATGSALDRLVALLGYTRYRAGRPTGVVQFSRRSGATGTVVIPAGIPITDKDDTIRYETAETRTMQAGESVSEVRVRAATDSTSAVAEHVLSVIQRAIAGIDAVDNAQPTSASAVDESDVELRARAKVALAVSNKGTPAAIRNGLLALPDVRDVTVDELPNGVPGELRVTISMAGGATAPTPNVLAKLEELRPAGIRLLLGTAATTTLAVRVGLVLAGSHLPAGDVENIHRRAAAALADAVAHTGVGQKVRAAPAAAAVLADARIVDVTIRLGRKGGETGAPGTDFVPDAGAAVRLEVTDVAFDPDVFEQAPGGGAAVAVNVGVTVAATPEPGTQSTELPALLEAKLAAFVTTLTPGTVVDADAALTALRDDARYQLDPLTLLVRFSTTDGFVEVASGGPAFTAQSGQTFTAEGVTLR